MFKVYALGDRLKYFDPVIEKIIDESLLDDNNPSTTGNVYQTVKDQQWLQDLATVMRNYNVSSFSAGRW
jgi:COPII coat assembly protein SEC16